MPRGFRALVAAQFVSGLADNALLIVGLAYLLAQDHPAWWAPLLKFAFTWSYVLLAPLAGGLADAVPKGRLMAWMNALKLMGAALLGIGVHPVGAFALVGLGAAIYAPAKYGLVTETVAPARLVQANGWIEVTVVLSVLLGTALGGALVALTPQHTRWLAPLHLALVAVLCLYALAALLNRWVPHAPAREALTRTLPTWHQWHSGWRRFGAGQRRLWRDPLGGLSLATTTLFWGAAAVMQFAVIHWADQVLGLPLSQAAYLQATVALGVILGAALASRRGALLAGVQLLPWGVVLGVLLMTVAWVHDIAWALPLLVATGAVGGYLVVPMNALLQYRGHRLLSPGRSIAVQGFNENLSVLLMLALYAGLLRLDVPVVTVMVGFGLSLALTMGVLIWLSRGMHRHRRKPFRPSRAAHPG
jgi:MFS transporter, LPLT family, lysophospholipid transporter